MRRARPGRTSSALGVLLAALLLAGCGLPTPGGVRTAGQIAPAQQQADALSVRPPGPIAGASPQQLVRGFLAAQSSPDDGYAVARTFLAPDVSWDPAAGVTVVGPIGPPTGEAPGPETAESALELEREVLGRIGTDGWSVRTLPVEVDFDYGLRRVNGQWRLTAVPPGLTLTEDDRDRSFALVQPMFLSLGPSRTGLVPDLVRLPNDERLPRRLVSQVLAGPSEGLRGSATTAVPEGTTVRGVTRSPTGDVTVDLSGPLADLDDDRRRLLSAQLLWTLRLGLARVNQDLASMLLLVDGQPYDVAGDDGPQPPDRWTGELDPTGGEDERDALAVGAGGRLVSLSPEGRPSALLDVDTGGPTDRVVEAVEDAATGRLAVLAGPADPRTGPRTLSVGSTAGSLAPVRTDAELLSPTWGDGTHGVWLLRAGTSPAVLVVDPGGTRRVAVDGPVELTRGSVLRVSRDGARVALVDGFGALRVGRVEVTGRVLRVVDLRTISAPGVRVRDVAWADGTTLLALDREPDPDIPRPLLQVGVDGVSRTDSSLNTSAAARTRTVTAFGDQVLVAAESSSGSGADSRFPLFRRVTGSATFANALSVTPRPDLVRPRLPG